MVRPEAGEDERRRPTRSRPVIVFNRAPFEPSKDGRTRRGAGGVVTALTALAARVGADWVACARTGAERRFAEQRSGGLQLPQGAGAIHYALPTADEQRMHYSVIANPVLWYTQHYLWDLAREPRFNGDVRRAWRRGYTAVNRKMAEVAADLCRHDGGRPLVFVHDYQLYLVPRLLRALAPQVLIEHFTHIPWPTPQYWKVLARELRDGIVNGLLGADLIGFQSAVDVHNFLLTCRENCGLPVDYSSASVHVDGRAVRVREYPISIDVGMMERLSRSPAVAREEEELRRWRPKHLIVRVDRTDPTKNIVRGFLAYEKLLCAHPELHGEVQFWAFLQPSRQEVPRYRSFLYSIRSTVNRINHHFASDGWEPIRLELGESLRRAVAAYKNFDVLLVNSIFDGMNLVAKEGMTLNERDGVLVLSENTGVHQELGRVAVSINPFEVDASADALYEALMMPAEERRRRSREAKATIRANDISRWIDRQLHDLEEVSRLQPSRLAG